MAADVYMPSTYSETVEELLVNCDTSYSIYRDVTKFLSEIQSICLTVKPERVRVLYWGDEVVRDEVYDSSTMAKLADMTEPQIGGGTVIECVVDYMKENDIKPQAVINFTDGYLAGSWGEWDCPVLWCILDNKRAAPDNGKVLHIKSENL
jgi:predicted metal-dependent peptidase